MPTPELPPDGLPLDGPATVDLSRYRNRPGFNKGRGVAVRVLWHVVNALFLQNPLNPSSSLKVAILRLFGAKIGAGGVWKTGINVKHPWFLDVGDHVWVGEGTWFDNTFAPITLGSHVCLSQGVYLCTGNHDWTDPAFGLIEKPLVIEDGAWIGARASVLPGAHVATHAVIAGGAVLARKTEPYTVYAGNPAQPVRKRVLKDAPPPSLE